MAIGRGGEGGVASGDMSWVALPHDISTQPGSQRGMLPSFLPTIHHLHHLRQLQLAASAFPLPGPNPICPPLASFAQSLPSPTRILSILAQTLTIPTRAITSRPTSSPASSSSSSSSSPPLASIVIPPACSWPPLAQTCARILLGLPQSACRFFTPGALEQPPRVPAPSNSQP